MTDDNLGGSGEDRRMHRADSAHEATKAAKTPRGIRGIRAWSEYQSVRIPGVVLAAAMLALGIALSLLVALWNTFNNDYHGIARELIVPDYVIAECALYAALLLWGGYSAWRRGTRAALLLAVALHIAYAIVMALNKHWNEPLALTTLLTLTLVCLICSRSSRQFFQTCTEIRLSRAGEAIDLNRRQWWGDHELVNGVFKGGGAKGIAYAGALEAMDERNLWFGSVAGTSAGAITATLIASGCDPQDMRALVPPLLKAIKRTRIGMVLGTRSSLFDNRSLRMKLEAVLCTGLQRPIDMNSPVTFKDLYESQEYKISLYVVALDLSRAAPVVFSVHTTPDVSVSGAVMASSAIPVGFPSVRGIFRSGHAIWVQRLVDGGAWANLPRFIYYDPSFAAWIKTARPDANLEEERQRPTVGFALGFDDTSMIQPDLLSLDSTGTPEFDKGTTHEAGNRWMWAVGGILSSQTMRFLTALALVSNAIVLLVNVQAAVTTFWDGIPAGVWNLIPEHPDALRDEMLPALAVLYMLAIVMGCVLPLVAVCFSRPAGDVLIPAARAALAAGTGVAPWVGAASDDHIIRLDPGALETTDFRPSRVAQDAAIGNARIRTLAYIDARLTEIGSVAPIASTPEQVSTVTEDGRKQARIDGRQRFLHVPGYISEVVRLYAAPLLTLFLGLILIVAFGFTGTLIVENKRNPTLYWLVTGIALAVMAFLVWTIVFVMARWHQQIARKPTRYMAVVRIPAVVMVCTGIFFAIGLPLAGLGFVPPTERSRQSAFVLQTLGFMWLARVGLWPLQVTGRDRGLRSIRY